MTEGHKRVGDLQPGDGVVLSPFCHGRIVSAKPSHSTPVRSRRGLLGVATIIVFEAIDGPYAGQRDCEFRHPDDEIRIRS